MATVKMEFKDNDDGTVTVTMDPLAGSLIERHYNTVDGLTSAESYALHAANRVRLASKEERVKGSPLAIDTNFSGYNAPASTLAIPGKKNPY
jgi:hypothetical protein